MRWLEYDYSILHIGKSLYYVNYSIVHTSSFKLKIFQWKLQSRYFLDHILYLVDINILILILHNIDL